MGDPYRPPAPTARENVLVLPAGNSLVAWQVR